MSLRDHRPFVVLLVLGAALRVVVQIAFPPGFVFSDGPGYLGLVDDLTPLDQRVVGYGAVLHALAWVSRDVSLVVALQHLLGLVTAVLAYVFLRHWRVGRWAAALATVPVLFDGMQLVIEHSVLSDVLFDVLVLAGVAVLAWRPTPHVTTSAVAGLLLGAATCVRVVGEPLLVAAVLFCLLAATTWRGRLVNALVVSVTVLAPLGAYAGWYHAEHGRWALSESGGRALYMRTTAFVDCDRVDVPDYQRGLCPAEPLGRRLEPTEYGWHTPDADHGLTPPAGVSVDQAMHEFATTVIRTQPAGYLRVVGRDVALNFWVPREDRYEYATAEKWSFQRYVDLRTTGFTRPAYLAHGGELPTARQPWADLLSRYGGIVYLWGPALLALVLVALAGSLARRRDVVDPGPTRTVTALVLVAGVGLMIAPDVTAEFVWRYQLPAVVLVPLAAALAWARLRARATG